MSEYTPTTDTVWEWIEQDTLPGMRDEVRRQFDRWLAQREAETLLDAQASLHTLYDEMGDPDPEWVRGIQSAARRLRDRARGLGAAS